MSPGRGEDFNAKAQRSQSRNQIESDELNRRIFNKDLRTVEVSADGLHFCGTTERRHKGAQASSLHRGSQASSLQCGLEVRDPLCGQDARAPL